MSNIPKAEMESTTSLLSQGYDFIQNTCKELNSDIFETRLLFEKVICMKGEKFAELFYDRDRFTREGAAPKPMKKTLLGEGGLQTIDGEEHLHRKKMFMSLMGEESRRELLAVLQRHWKTYIKGWQKKEDLILFEEVQKLLCQGTCEWAGVPLKDDDVTMRASELGAMIDGSGGVALRFYKGQKGRKEEEAWIGSIIRRVREGKLPVKEGTALHTIAWHRTLSGQLLDQQIAAVELLNIIRPTVAVARFIIFAAVALHEHPAYRDKLENASDEELHNFVQEVRRFYPFFPMLVAKVKKPFTWEGYEFPDGRRVFLDLYGTNNDPKIWKDPENFRPERFTEGEKGPYAFIPQGGGDHTKNHRCPGEWITIDVMNQAIRQLLSGMEYTVPHQDLSISHTRIPAIPKSRFIIKNVKPKVEKEISEHQMHSVAHDSY